jgi:hypothetical protein
MMMKHMNFISNRCSNSVLLVIFMVYLRMLSLAEMIECSVNNESEILRNMWP